MPNICCQVQTETASFARHLLKSKNIIILQEVYGYLTGIYESALISLADVEPFLKKTISNDKSTIEEKQICSKKVIGKHSYLPKNLSSKDAEKVIHFTLSCLSDLINAKGSVLSMWALDPSVFTLLVNYSGLLNKVSNCFICSLSTGTNKVLRHCVNQMVLKCFNYIFRSRNFFDVVHGFMKH